MLKYEIEKTTQLKKIPRQKNNNLKNEDQIGRKKPKKDEITKKTLKIFQNKKNIN